MKLLEAMLTSVNSASSLFQVVSNGDDDEEEELEFRSYVDNAWYSVRVAFDGRAGKLIVRYCNFPDENDSVYETGKFFTFEELDDSADGLLVCTSHAFTYNDVLFYNAVVEHVNHKKHSFADGEEECLCSFMLVWQHGPNANSLTEKKIESICIVQSIQNLNPNLTYFIKMAKEKIKSYAHISSSVSNATGTNCSDVGVQSLKQATKCVEWSASDISPSEEVGRSSNLLKRNREDADFGGVGNYYTNIA